MLFLIKKNTLYSAHEAAIKIGPNVKAVLNIIFMKRLICKYKYII